MTEKQTILRILAENASLGQDSISILYQLRPFLENENDLSNMRMAFDIGILAAANCSFTDIEPLLTTLSRAGGSVYNEQDEFPYTLVQVSSSALFFNNTELFRNIAHVLSMTKVTDPGLLEQKRRIDIIVKYPLETVGNWRDVLLSESGDFLEIALQYLRNM